MHLPVASLPDAALSKLIRIGEGSHENRRDFRRVFGRANPKQKRAISDSAVELTLDRFMRKVCAEPDEIV